MKRVALYTTVILATLGGAALIYSFPEAVVMFLISLSIAATIRPLIDTLAQRGLPAGVAVLITFLGILVSLVILVWVVGGLVVNNLGAMGDYLAVMYDRMWATWPQGTAFQQTVIRQLPAPADLYSAFVGDQGGALVQTVMGVTTSSVGVLSQFFGALVLSIYWTADRIHFERLWLSVLPVEQRSRWRTVGRDIENALGAYIRSELAQSLLVGVLLGLGYSLIGLPYPALLAVFAAFAWLLPWIGGVLPLIPVLVVGWSAGWLVLVIALVFTIAVLLVMELIVEPRIASRRQYSPWLTIILIMIMGQSFGLFGVILAPPLAAMVLISARRILQETQVAASVPAQEVRSAREIAGLDERIAAVRAMIDNLEEPLSMQTTSMLDRLAGLVQKAQEISHEDPRP